ncbi:MAG: hypothetical protein HQK75_02285 [Candidatus Magnetomorum sp.]|nr:hypothetical protein [Candidatus Magnetomorum sp.]
MKHMFIVFLIILLFAFSSVSCCSEVTFFTGVNPTNIYHQYIGKVSIEKDSLENGQDELGIYVPDETNGSRLIGSSVIGENYAGYYFINVYGDDNETPIKDGAYIDDVLTFKIWDKSNDKLYVLSNENSLSVENAAGVNIPDIPPIFSSGFGTQYGYLNLMARNADLLATIISFKGLPQKDSVKLVWTTSLEIDHSGFLLFRQEPPSDIFYPITPFLIPSKGNAFNGAQYCHIDKNMVNNAVYVYQLISVDLKGQSTILQTTGELTHIKLRHASCPLNMDLNDDCQFNMADILELMKTLGQ